MTLAVSVQKAFIPENYHRKGPPIPAKPTGYNSQLVMLLSVHTHLDVTLEGFVEFQVLCD
jgi:hypothetical protein